MTEAHNILDRTELESTTNRRLVAGSGVREPVRERKCTDVYCLVLFVFFNACLWTLSGWSYQEGDPQRLVHGWDVHGKFCGTGELQDSGYTYFPVPLDSIDITLCLPGCPVVAAEQSVCLYDNNLMDLSDFGCYNAYPSRPFYNNYCLPADREQRTKVMSWLYSQDQVMTRVVGDLARAWDELAIAGVVTFGAMMVFFIGFKLRYCALPLFFISTLVIMFLFAVLTYLLHEENWRVNGQICQPFGPVRMDECDEGDTAHGYRDLAWTVASIGFACGLAIICMVPKLWKGHKILQHTSRAMGFHPLQFACPCAALVLGTAFYAYFITLLIFTVSTGSHSHSSNEYIPWGEFYEWEFSTAERVLVFFDVGMILWWFSFIAHSVEYVTAGTTSEWFFSTQKKDMVAHTRRAVHTLFRYHSGSVILASVLIPAGRLLRNLLGAVKYTIRHVCGACLGFGAVGCKPCLLAYDYWFKYMTSDALAYMSIWGDNFIHSAKKGYFIVKRNDGEKKAQQLLNSGNMIIWLYQLVIMMSGVIFCAWWLQYDDMTFKDLPSFQVTSITAMAIYELFITWFFAQLYGSYVRGVMHTSMVAYLVDKEGNNGECLQESPFGNYMNQNRATGFDPNVEISKAKDGKVAPMVAPVASEGLMEKGPGLAGSVPPQTAAAGPSGQPEDISQHPATAPVHPPSTAVAAHSVPAGDDVETVSAPKQDLVS